MSSEHSRSGSKFLESFSFQSHSPSRERSRSFNRVAIPIGKTLLWSEANISSPSWYHSNGETFQVRKGPDYESNKLKAASLPSLCELIAVDLWKTKKKIKNIGQFLDLPSDEEFPILIVNCMIPGYEPPNPLWGSNDEDGEGYSLVTYFRLRPELFNVISSSKNESKPPFPALSLYNEFTTNPRFDRDRFKMIARISNLDSVDVNSAAKSLLSSYNSTPFLTRPQHECFYQPDYFEFDIDVHRFGYLPRSGLYSVMEVLEKVMFEYAFVVEGRSDHELPENILGCVGLRNIRLKNSTPFPR